MASLLNPDQPMVVPADIARRLNDRFYSSKPHRYFEVRLLALLSLDDDRTALSDSTLGEHALGGELEFEPETIDPTEIELFVAAEAEVLHHHASEVLVRYLLGHAGFPACPWLEIASLSNFRDFKQTASNWANLDAGTFRREVRELCFGNQVETDFQREQASVVAAVAQAAASRILNLDYSRG